STGPCAAVGSCAAVGRTGRTRPMNSVLLRRTWRALACRTLIIALGLAIWGALMPVIYSQFGAQFKQLFDSGQFPKQIAEFGGGDIFSLPGAIALGFVHPISVAL